MVGKSLGFLPQLVVALIASTLGNDGPAAKTPSEEHRILVMEWEKAYRDYHKTRARRCVRVLGSPFSSTVGAGGLHAGAEQLLRAAMEKSPHRRVRGNACFSLAWYMESHSRLRSGGMSRPQADAMNAESMKRFEQVIELFADGKGGGPYTLGQLAEAALFEARNLGIGKVAPEITGDEVVWCGLA